MMPKVPLEDRAFLRDHKQVFRGASNRSQWMTQSALRKAVRSGESQSLVGC